MNRALKGILLILGILILLFLVFRNPDKTLDQLKPIYADVTSQWMEIDGQTVHYRKEGNGPPVILLHGTGSSLHTWDGWTVTLKDQFTVFRMDLPAFGLTGPAGDRDYSIQAYVDFVDEFVLRQGLDTFALAGNSLGGYIAWAYTVDHPEKIRKLILLDAAGYPHEGDSDALAFKIAANPVLRPLMKHVTPKSFIRKNLEQVYADDDKVTEALVTRYHDMTLRQGNRQAFIDRVHTHHPDISERINEISCPTLIMWGAMDTWTPVKDAARFDKDIPNSRLIMYDDVGHVPMEEIPEQSGRDALSFLLESQVD